MFNYMITLLASEFATEIHDLIFTSPAETPYNVLNEMPIKRTAAFSHRCLEQLYSTEKLGNRKLT